MKLNKVLTSMACVALGASLVACDGGESSDPATASRGDLNPPGTLETITGDSQLTLWWTAGNVEEEFKGYYVFATTEATPGTYSYPDGSNVQSVGIPRCADNTAFFEAFGLPATDRDCEGETEAEEGGTDADGEAFALQDDGEEDAAGDDGSVDVEEPLKNWVPCVDDSGNNVSADLSMPGTAPVVTPQSCTIKKYYDAASGELKDMVNGTTYMFFVVAVMGDDLSQISWTTPLVTDTPSADVFPSASVELSEGKYIGLEFDTTTSPWTAAFSTEADCASGVCGLSTPTTLTAGAKPTVYFGRASGGSYPQRIFISGTAGGAVKVQPRGPQTAYGDTTGATRIPGDEAASTYPEAGTGYIVYKDQIFDFEITDGGSTYYGKVHIDTVTFAGDANTGKATLKVAAVLQPQAGQTQYISFQ